MGFFRRTPVVRSRPEGGFELVLDAERRELLVSLLGQLRDLLDEQPDHPNLTRLHPPAYPDDPEADAGYQLLAGEELRESQRSSIDAVIDSLGRDRLTEDELWSWVQSLNGVRLVVGTRLQITDDDHGPSLRSITDPDDRTLWVVYDFATQLQHDVVEALSGGFG